MPVGADGLPMTENTSLRAIARKSGANVQQLRVRGGETAWPFHFHLRAEAGVIQDAFLMLFWTLRKPGFSYLPLLFVYLFLVAT